MIKLKIKFVDGERYSFCGEIIESKYGYICLKNIRDQADNIVKENFKIYEPNIVSSKDVNIGDIIKFDARVKTSEGIIKNLDNITRVKLLKKDTEETLLN